MSMWRYFPTGLKWDVISIKDVVRPRPVTGVVANITSQQARRNVGNLICMESFINFTFRFDAIQLDTLRILQENSTLPFNIVSE